MTNDEYERMIQLASRYQDKDTPPTKPPKKFREFVVSRITKFSSEDMSKFLSLIRMRDMELDKKFCAAIYPTTQNFPENELPFLRKYTLKWFNKMCREGLSL